MRRKEELKPLCITYRTICGFVFLFSLMGLGLLGYFIREEGFHYLSLPIGFALGMSLNVTATIVLTAYAPFYFRFVHLPLDINADIPKN